jgi:hypothetical protein
MSVRAKILQQAYLLILGQYLILWFTDKLPFLSLVFIFLCSIVSLGLLLWRVEKDKNQDYFPSEDLVKKENREIKVLVLGKELEPESHENEKDERYFRVTDTSLGNKMLISLVAYIGLVLVITQLLNEVGAENASENKTLYSIVTLPPAIFFGATFATRTHGQLLFLPTVSFLYVFFNVPWLKLETQTLFLYMFSLLFFTLSSFKLIDSLRIKKPLTFFENPYPAIPFATLATALFVILMTVFPLRTISPQKTVKKKTSLQKMNRSLGRLKPNGTDDKFVRNLKSLKNNVDDLKMKPDKLSNMLDQAGKQIDKIGDLLGKIPQLDVSIPTSDLNLLVNNQKSLQRELQDLQGQITPDSKVDPEILRKIEDLMKKIDQNARKLRDLGLNTHPQTKRDFEELNPNMQGYFSENLKEGIREDLREEFSLQGDEEFQEKAKDLLKNLDSNEIASPLEALENQKTQLISQIDKEIKKEEKKRDLIDPNLLEKIVKFLKYAVMFLGSLFIYHALRKYFSNKVEDEDEESLSKEDRKRLLLKRRYSSSSEEVRTLFLQYMEALKKVYYGEDEPPPPKVLYSELIETFPKRKKVLSYFLEVFSLSEYRAQEIPRKVLVKYRKAYRRLIKDL